MRSLQLTPSSFAALFATLVSLSLMSSALDAGDLEAKDGKQWYKGNLHTHSHWSDGDDYPEMIGLWYKENGYQFLALTDHNVLANYERWIDVDMSKGGREAYDKLKARFPENWVDERTVDGILEVRLKTFDEFSGLLNEEGSFLMMLGEEVTDIYKTSPIHMNISNLKEMIPPMKG